MIFTKLLTTSLHALSLKDLFLINCMTSGCQLLGINKDATSCGAVELEDLRLLLLLTSMLLGDGGLSLTDTGVDVDVADI